jgi:hypothetical protein
MQADIPPKAVNTGDKVIAGVVVTVDNLSPVSLFPAITNFWCRC